MKLTVNLSTDAFDKKLITNQDELIAHTVMALSLNKEMTRITNTILDAMDCLGFGLKDVSHLKFTVEAPMGAPIMLSIECWDYTIKVMAEDDIHLLRRLLQILQSLKNYGR